MLYGSNVREASTECKPDKFPYLMAAALSEQDISLWKRRKI